MAVLSRPGPHLGSRLVQLHMLCLWARSLLQTTPGRRVGAGEEKEVEEESTKVFSWERETVEPFC